MATNGGIVPERPASNMSHGSGVLPSYQDETLPDVEPTEEDVARAFAVYDVEGLGEMSTLALDGESCSMQEGPRNHEPRLRPWMSHKWYVEALLGRGHLWTACLRRRS